MPAVRMATCHSTHRNNWALMFSTIEIARIRSYTVMYYNLKLIGNTVEQNV